MSPYVHMLHAQALKNGGLRHPKHSLHQGCSCDEDFGCSKQTTRLSSFLSVVVSS